jgi:glycosyltransferase involved in cell wall biosynthesis
MISIILPYWDRKDAAERGLKTLEQYPDLEVVLVDDGNAVPFVSEARLNIKYVRLPAKSEPKSPVTCWNEGVKAASGDVIVISCVEILHEKPILGPMLEQLETLGPDGYVLAAAWCPEFQEWHTHSTRPVPTCPPGTGLAFCGMMYRSLYEKAGGWDEDYREGAGYEDRDFIQRMTKAGAKFCIRDDLVVTHPKSGARIDWGAEKFARNERLYYEKWDIRPITFCCVSWGNYCGRGVEYVNVLHDMIERNMVPGVPWRFVCFTDDPAGVNAECRPLPDLDGWHNKIYLFKPGLFEPGERIAFFDLDTLIMGSLDEVVGYRGKFATLRDFWRPDGLGPAVILWESGAHPEIWTEYEKAGYPKLERGDQEWLESLNLQSDILQDIFPGKFLSYKTHCNPYPAQDAAVVCFHGYPRPHECTQKWVQDTWKIGGNSSVNIQIAPNTDVATLLRHVRENKDKAPWICESPVHDLQAVIVGSGPSVEKDLPLIQAHYEHGSVIFALNNAARFLFKHGIQPHYQVMMDAREQNTEFLGGYAQAYLLASMCHPEVFKHCHPILMWHPMIPGIETILTEQQTTTIGGSTTVGLCSMGLCYAMGYRKIDLFGYDSSFTGNITHAIPQSRNDLEKMGFDVTVGDKTFRTNAAMAKQAEIFPMFAQRLADLDVRIRVFGEGLLPYIAKHLTT